VWVDGYLAGVRANKSLDLRDWTWANEVIPDWEIVRAVTKEATADVPVREACETFLADVEAQRQSDASLKKYRVLLINERKPENREKHSPSLAEFCEAKGIQFPNQITSPVVVRFRGE